MSCEVATTGTPTHDTQESVIRIFIFSSFHGMHEERDHLVTVVVPELREERQI